MYDIAVLIPINFVDVGQSVLTARIQVPSHPGPTMRLPMQSYASPQLEGHNTLPLPVSSRGQTVDTNMISMAVNQAKRSRPGGINHYVKLQLYN